MFLWLSPGCNVVNVRGTTRFRKRLRQQVQAEAIDSTTKLGDWYANILHFGHRQVVLCTSAKSLLSVVFSAQRLRQEFGENLRRSVGTVLRGIGVPEEAVSDELEQMKDYVVTGTESRSVLGSMNDFKIQVEYRLADFGDDAYEELTFELSEVLCGPLDYGRPAEVALELFGATPRRKPPLKLL